MRGRERRRQEGWLNVVNGTSNDHRESFPSGVSLERRRRHENFEKYTYLYMTCRHMAVVREAVGVIPYFGKLSTPPDN